MKSKIHEPEGEYIADIIDLSVKAAIAEELERRRELGLPIVFDKDGKIVVMVGDNIVEEKRYENS